MLRANVDTLITIPNQRLLQVVERGTSLRDAFREPARALNLPLHEGVYAGLSGPQYETPAEVRMLRTLGADAVGMSTVHETIQARALGLEVVAFSCLTNWAAGLSPGWKQRGDGAEWLKLA